jgi:hypothetical protein
MAIVFEAKRHPLFESRSSLDGNSGLVIDADIGDLNRAIIELEGMVYCRRIAIDSDFHLILAGPIKLCHIEVRFRVNRTPIGVNYPRIIRDFHDDSVTRIVLIDE